MNIEPLAIPLIRQEPGSDDCLRCCALMVFTFFEDKIEKDELWKRLHVYQKHSGLSGAYLQDLGKLALKRGYKATIFHYDWQWWNEAAASATKGTRKKLITALRNLKRTKNGYGQKQIINKEVTFIKAGGKFKIELPNTKNIDACLYVKTPPVVIVRGEDLRHSPNASYPHSIVIIGKIENKYLIRDPLSAIDEIDEGELLYAWNRAGGWLLSLKPKERIPQVFQPSLLPK